MTNKTLPLLGRGIDINEIRKFLILARLFSQKAQAGRELAQMGWLDTVEAPNTIMNMAKARYFRARARWMLKMLEIDAGAQFSKLGVATVAARDLKGSQFKDWPVYKSLFVRASDAVDRWSQ